MLLIHTRYDGFGRRITSRKHVGQDQTWSDGWLDEAFAFDDGGRLQQITIENGATTGIANQTTQFKYDAQGRRTQRIKPDGREERTIFDLGGRLAKVEHSSALGSQACGAGTTQCVELTRIYDTASRLLELRGRHILGPSAPSSAAQHYRGSSTDILLQSFTLDGLGRAVVTRDVNDPTTTADDGWTHARFDSVGRLTHQGYGGDATSAQWTVASAFDPAGRRTTINTPAFGTAPATTIQTNFDLLGRPTSVIDEHGTNPDETIAGFGYIGFDRLVEQSRGDGTTWQAHDGSQDFFDFATRRTGARITNGAGSILFEEQIRYDQRNEVRAVVWSHGRAGNDSEAQTYAFDELGRLIDFKQGLWDPGANSGVGAIAAGDPNLTAARSWQLDVLGNWRAHDPSGDGQGPLQPQLDAVNAYTHFPAVVDTDANGSPDTLQHLPLTYDEARGFLFERVEQLSGTTAVKTIEYQHDLLGRLVQVTRKTSGTPTVLAQYGYLADGRLAWRCPGVCDGSGGPRRWLVYDGSQPIHEGTGAAGVAPEWSYVWLGSTLLKATGSSAGERFVHHDRLGSVVMETRSSAGSVQVLGRATYDPYGRPTAIPSWSGASLQVPYGYAGARREDAAGLYLMGARWYDPTLGRFIEQDPIGELGGVNLYAYTGSSPISWTDPSGLYTKGGKNRLAYGKPEASPTKQPALLRVDAISIGAPHGDRGYQESHNYFNSEYKDARGTTPHPTEVVPGSAESALTSERGTENGCPWVPWWLIAPDDRNLSGYGTADLSESQGTLIVKSLKWTGDVDALCEWLNSGLLPPGLAASVNRDGHLEIRGTQSKTGTDLQETRMRFLEAASRWKGTTQLEVVKNHPDVAGDDIEGRIDIGDVDRAESWGLWMAIDSLVHPIIEQYALQNGKNADGIAVTPGEAHATALNATAGFLSLQRIEDQGTIASATRNVNGNEVLVTGSALRRFVFNDGTSIDGWITFTGGNAELGRVDK